MSSGGGGGSSTQTQKIDPWMKDQIQKNMGRVDAIAADGYQPYTGQGVLGLNQGTQNAISGLQGMSGNNQWTGVLGQGVSGLEDTQGYNAQQIDAGQADLSQFQNPYTNQVVNSTLSDIDRARQMAVNQTQDQSIAAGAFGGDRSALADAATNSEYARQAASAAGQLRNQGFNTALGAAQNQQQMDLAAQQSNQQAGLDSQRLNYLASQGLLGAAQAGNALQTGNYQNALNASQIAQQNAQDQENFNYQQYQAQQQYPYQLQQLYNSTLFGSPSISTTTSSQGAGTNRTTSALGGAATGASVGSSFGPWGAAIGGGVGLLGGMFA